MREIWVLVVIIFAGCAAGSDGLRDDNRTAMADCVANAELREGESLGSRFRARATVAHCEKSLAVDTRND